MKEKEVINKIWNNEAKKYIENALSYATKEKIKLPDGEDYLTMFAETYKTDEEPIQEIKHTTDYEEKDIVLEVKVCYQ